MRCKFFNKKKKIIERRGVLVLDSLSGASMRGGGSSDPINTPLGSAPHLFLRRDDGLKLRPVAAQEVRRDEQQHAPAQPDVLRDVAHHRLAELELGVGVATAETPRLELGLEGERQGAVLAAVSDERVVPLGGGEGRNRGDRGHGVGGVTRHRDLL